MIFPLETTTSIIWFRSQPHELTANAAALFILRYCASVRPEDKNITTMNWDTQNSRNSQRMWRRVAGFLPSGLPGGGKSASFEPSSLRRARGWAAYELADITGLNKKRRGCYIVLWHTRAPPLWRRSVRLAELPVWVDSGLFSVTRPLVEDARTNQVTCMCALHWLSRQGDQQSRGLNKRTGIYVNSEANIC